MSSTQWKIVENLFTSLCEIYTEKCSKKEKINGNFNENRIEANNFKNINKSSTDNYFGNAIIK